MRRSSDSSGDADSGTNPVLDIDVLEESNARHSLFRSYKYAGSLTELPYVIRRIYVSTYSPANT